MFVKNYLVSEYGIQGRTLELIVDRFSRHPDISEEMEKTLLSGEFPKNGAITVSVDGVAYSAESIFVAGAASNIFGAYHLLAQLRENPVLISKGIKKGFVVK